MRRELILRPARPFDAIPCARIVDGWVQATDWLPRVHSRAEIVARCRARVEARAVTVAEAAGDVVGFLSLDVAHAQVTALFVEDRGRGIGSALIDKARAGQFSLTLWTFAANRPARRFYEREGFRPARTSAGDNAEGLPDVEYVWAAA